VAARRLWTPDWFLNGFASQVMWVATDGFTDYTKWVEAGITHGYKGQNIVRFYTAHGDENEGIYEEALLTSTQPVIGTAYGFEIFSASTGGSGTYRATVNNLFGSWNWNGHLPNTVSYSGGFESRTPNQGGCSGEVDATYVYRNRYHRKSDAIYYDITNGTLTDLSDQGTIEWCASSVTFKYWIHSQISGDVCP
jgi:hypothetical protein